MTIAVYVSNINDINDATKYYVETIVNNSGHDYLGIYTNLSALKKVNIILTIYSSAAIFAKLRYPRKYICNWFQGISPEESLMFGLSKFVYYKRSLAEFLCLKLCNSAFFVSNAMVRHYNDKYKSKIPHVVMPCVNKDLMSFECLYEHREYKERYSFVYAGGLQEWQCIEKTLEIHSILQSHIDDISLTFLCSDVERANILADTYGIRNFDAKYVPLEKLDKELLKYDFGYLIRENNIVNNVSTPTKFSSYLSSGIKVITTDAILDFNDIDSSFVLRLSSCGLIEDLAMSILEYVKDDQYDLDDLSDVFSRYLSSNKYFFDIQDLLRV